MRKVVNVLSLLLFHIAGFAVKHLIDNYLAQAIGRVMFEIDASFLHCRYPWWCEAFGALLALYRWTKRDLVRSEHGAQK